MIPSKQLLISILPKPTWQDKTNFQNGSNTDIIKVLEADAALAIAQVKPIAKYFIAATPQQTAGNLHAFIRANLGYRRDVKGLQQIRMPNRYLVESGDCKSKALFIYSVLSCIYPGKVYFRFANYDIMKGTTPSHVYVVLKIPNENNITIDGTYQYFNREIKPNYFRDMKIQTLSDNASDIGRLGLKSHAKKSILRTSKKHLASKDLHRKKRKGVVKLGVPIHDEAEIGKLGAKLKNAAKKVGGAVKTAAKATGQATKAAAKATGGAVKTAAKATGKAAVKVEKAGVKATKAVGKAVVKVAKKGINLALKVQLAPARGAYLALVALNAFRWADKLATQNQSKLKNKWEALGGDFNILQTNIKRGKGKHGIGDDMNGGGIGEPVTVSLAAATPVIVAMVKEFGKDLGKEAIDSTKQKLLGGAKNLVTGGASNLAQAAKNKLLAAGKDAGAAAVNNVVQKAQEKFQAATGGDPGGGGGGSASDGGSEQAEAEAQTGAQSSGFSFASIPTPVKVVGGLGLLALGYMAIKKKGKR